MFKLNDVIDLQFLQSRSTTTVTRIVYVNAVDYRVAQTVSHCQIIKKCTKS